MGHRRALYSAIIIEVVMLLALCGATMMRGDGQGQASSERGDTGSRAFVLHDDRFQDEMLRPSMAHGSISISGNAGLVAFPDKTGSGTFATPYVIKDLEIHTSLGANGIYIDSIDLYLVIQNCTVTGSLDGGNGIQLSNCKSVQIVNCTIYDFSLGLLITGSETISIKGCTIRDNDNGGLVASSSSMFFDNNTFNDNGWGLFAGMTNSIIEDTIASGNSGTGIIVAGGSSNVTVKRAFCTSNSGAGIATGASNNITITNCTLVGNMVWGGVSMTANNSIVSDCVFQDNYNYGIKLNDCINVNTTGNHIIENSLITRGIYLLNTNSSTSSSNIINGSGGNGMLLENSWSNTIRDSNFTNNYDFGLNMVAGSAGNSIIDNFFKGNGDLDVNGSSGNVLSGNEFFPDARFFKSITNPTTNDLIRFTVFLMKGNEPLSFQWNFGDGTANSTDSNPEHAYSWGGHYNVTLTIVDDDGDIDVAMIGFTVAGVGQPTSPPIQVPGFESTVTGISIIFIVGIITHLARKRGRLAWS